MFGTASDAVHAHQALGLAPWSVSDGVVPTLAVEEAAIAAIAAFGVLVQAQN